MTTPATPSFATPDDVDTLIASGITTEAALAAAVAEMRRRCGWHVYPLWETHEVTVTATGGRSLCLPTLKLVELHSVTENGHNVDVDSLDWSADGIVEKAHGGVWSTRRGGITAVITHGHADAPDLVAAVLDAAAGAAESPVGQGNGRERMGPFEFDGKSGIAYSAEHLATFDAYRLPWLP